MREVPGRAKTALYRRVLGFTFNLLCPQKMTQCSTISQASRSLKFSTFSIYVKLNPVRDVSVAMVRVYVSSPACKIYPLHTVYLLVQFSDEIQPLCTAAPSPQNKNQSINQSINQIISHKGQRRRLSILNRQEEEDGKTLVRDKRDRVIVCVFRRDLHLTLMFSGLLQKRSVWGLGFSVWGNFFLQTKLLSPLSHRVCCLL